MDQHQKELLLHALHKLKNRKPGPSSSLEFQGASFLCFIKLSAC